MSGRGDSAAANGAARVSVAIYSACALTIAGGVECWGNNAQGQLGNGTTTSSSVPVAVTGLTSAVSAVAAGGDIACALNAGGGLQCWGDNTFDELGNADATSASGCSDSVCSTVPAQVTGLTSGVTAVAVGGFYFVCAVVNGGVQCWGSNSAGQLGARDNPMGAVPSPVVGLTSGFTAVAAGYNFACALSASGGVQCWGDNTYGELGNGGTASSSTPVQVTGLTSGVTAIAAASSAACALTAGGGVQCWGAYPVAPHGSGTPTTCAGTTLCSTVPVQVSGLTSGVTAISAGGDVACAITGGAAQCWGDDSSLQLETNSSGGPVPAPLTGLPSDVTAVAIGADSACAVAGSGSLECWGTNAHGELGNGTTAESVIPVAVTGL